jgi:hypothetical protein
MRWRREGLPSGATRWPIPSRPCFHDEPKAITAINARVPTVVAWVIEQCLSKDAAERIGATEDLARELRRVRERSPGNARRTEPLKGRAGGRWKMPAAMLGAAVITAIGILALEPAQSTLRFTTGGVVGRV